MIAKRKEREAGVVGKEGGSLLSVNRHHQIRALCSLFLHVKVGLTAVFKRMKMALFLYYISPGKKAVEGDHVL